MDLGEFDDVLLDQIDWDAIDDLQLLSSEEASPPLSIGEIEQFLMDDDAKLHQQEGWGEEFDPAAFLSDVLLDHPLPSEEGGSGSEEGEKKEVVGDDCCDNDDPLAKKRKRQLRNRDAAVKSRERRKEYVRDLEMKSKYFEAECRRLGMVLQCCVAENHALRISLQNTVAVDASMTKQESAVLVMESLLLGSLLWFLGIICLLILPSQLHATRKEIQLGNGESGSQPDLFPRKGSSEILRNRILQSFMMGKSCKASRSRMKTEVKAQVIRCIS